MTKYVYSGPVMEFGRCVASKWYGETYAQSPEKAKANLKYTWKLRNNRSASAKIDLPGRVTPWNERRN